MKLTTKLWVGLAILAVLSPLGLLVPEYFKAEAAWGEWGADELGDLVGYIPYGIRRIAGLWSAPIPDYAFKGWEEKATPHRGLAYMASAIIGMIAVVVAAFLIGRLLTREKR